MPDPDPMSDPTPERDQGSESVAASFDAIVEGLELDVPPDAEERMSQGRGARDDHSKPIEVAMLLPGVEQVSAMTAVSRLAGIDAVSVPSEIGAIVVLSDTGYRTARRSAEAFSQLLRQLPVVLLRRGPSDDPADSDVQASRWLAGQLEEELAPGLLLAHAPDLVEGMLLGDVDVTALPGAIATGSMSRMQATRILARMMRGRDS